MKIFDRIIVKIQIKITKEIHYFDQLHTQLQKQREDKRVQLILITEKRYRKKEHI